MKLVTLVLTLLLSSGCATKPYTLKQTADERDSGRNKIYLVSHGWHTGIVIPTKDLTHDLPNLGKRFGSPAHLEFGWGDKGFYQAEKITPFLVLKAIFARNDSVMHIVAVSHSPHKDFPQSAVLGLCLNHREYRGLIKFLAHSFRRDPAGQLIPLRTGIYGNSQFYEAVGAYHAMNTCNKWTAKALKATGMNISTTFKLTAESVMRYVRTRQSTTTSSIGTCP